MNENQNEREFYTLSDEDGNQIIVDDYGHHHVLVGWEGNPNWWEDYGIDKSTIFRDWRD